MLRTEQRSEPRVTARITVEAVGPTVNLSAGGICVLVNRQFSAGTEVLLDFDLPDGGASVACKGEVVWAHRSQIDADLHEIGMRFIDILDADRKRIDDFVETRLAEQEEAE